MFWTRKNNGLPDYWNAYRQKFEAKTKGSARIQDLTFIVLDTETTGFYPSQDRILSIGAIPVLDGTLHSDKVLEVLIKQETYSPEAATIHGIRHHVVTENGISEAEAVALLLDYVGSHIIIGHHIGFDVAMLNAMIKRQIGKKLLNKTFDTANLFKRAFIENYRYQQHSPQVPLDEIANTFNIVPHDRHSALGDAMITALAFVRILKKLEKKEVYTLRDLQRQFHF